MIGLVTAGLLLAVVILSGSSGCYLDSLDECLFEGQVCLPSDDDGPVDEPSCCENLRCADDGLGVFQCTVNH